MREKTIRLERAKDGEKTTIEERAQIEKTKSSERGLDNLTAYKYSYTQALPR